jgi:hypothetical protein
MGHGYRSKGKREKAIYIRVYSVDESKRLSEKYSFIVEGGGIPIKKCEHDRSPLLFGERVRVRGKMRLWWSFRSPYVLCFSIATEPVNVPGWLTATTLATRAPGQENRRFAVHSSYAV